MHRQTDETFYIERLIQLGLQDNKSSKKYGILYGLSTLGTTSPEDLAKEVPDVRRWYQLYVRREREPNEKLVARVKASGFEAIVLTVDTVVGGVRYRDVKNGLTVSAIIKWYKTNVEVEPQ